MYVHSAAWRVEAGCHCHADFEYQLLSAADTFVSKTKKLYLDTSMQQHDMAKLSKDMTF